MTTKISSLPNEIPNEKNDIALGALVLFSKEIGVFFLYVWS